MTTKKQDPPKQEKKQDAPAADPSSAPGGAADADALKQASGEAVKDESGNQEDWRERYDEEGPK